MCRELEAVGLPDPTFNNDNFILRTTVRSSAFGKQVIQLAEQAIQPQNRRFNRINQAIWLQNRRFKRLLLKRFSGYATKKDIQTI